MIGYFNPGHAISILLRHSRPFEGSGMGRNIAACISYMGCFLRERVEWVERLFWLRLGQRDGEAA